MLACSVSLGSLGTRPVGTCSGVVPRDPMPLGNKAGPGNEVVAMTVGLTIEI